jgi:2-succinyl-5-enolpyruvyl-6-hydroxy-3-cyclohexene-1-carboxylate synthase
MSQENLLAEWARLLLGSLARAGVREAVVSPGSRSTPFAWAAHQEPGLCVRTVVDERAAAFFALGQARATGRPTLLICTSGTAAANYFPAIVEASLAFVPLIALTADRPFEAQQSGSAQTIDQLKLYGDHCRAFFELGLPDAAPSALHGLRRMAAQAVARSLSPEPGPVHLNARAQKPLEPVPAQSDGERELARRVDALLAVGPTAVASQSREPDRRAVERLARACRGAERGLIVCGPLSPEEAGDGRALAELHRRTRFPILAEATSQFRFRDDELARAVIGSFDLLLRSPSFAERSVPDLVLSVGATPTSSGLERLLAAHPGVERHVIAPYGWPDPQGTARSVTVGRVEATLHALASELGTQTPRAGGPWESWFVRAAEIARRSLDQALASSELSEGSAVRAALDALPDGALLIAGNSLPLRDIDAYAPSRPLAAVVLSQRGANGIDGLVAGAAGAASALGKPALLLVGDVSLLHDLNSLAIAAKLDTPLAIAVLDNAGGRIFEQLPVARLLEADPKAAELWLTPPGLELEHAARLFGIGYAAPRSAAEVRSAVAAALEQRSATLLRIQVGKRSARELDRAVVSAIDRAFAEPGPAGP